MNWFQHRGLWVNLAIAVSFFGTLAGAGAVASSRLDDKTKSALQLQRDMGAQVMQFRAADSHSKMPDLSGIWSERLEQSYALVENRRERLAAVARAADEAGVDLVSLRGVEPAETETSEETAVKLEADVLFEAHRVGFLGRFDQVSRFLDELAGGAGAVGLQELLVRSAPEVQGAASAGLLRGEVTVTWYALEDPEQQRGGS